MDSVIFKKVLHEMTEEFKSNIKLLNVFKDNDDKINLFLITNDDKVHCFGSNSNGVLGFGHKEEISHLTINEDLSNKQIIEFSNSYCHTIAKNIDGKLFCWGYNESGVIGNAIEDNQVYKPDSNKYLLNERIVEFCCGAYHTLVLTANGDVYSWGSNNEGQIGNGSYDNVLMPFNVFESIGEKVKAIACGLSHSMVLTTSGRVYSWGDNFNGELGIGNRENSSLPKPIELDKKIIIVKISCGSEHSLLLSSEKEIYVFGCNEFKQLGIKTDEVFQCLPIKLCHPQKFIEIASNPYHKISFAISENNSYHFWGDCGENGIISEPKEIPNFTLNEYFVHSFGITYKTINQLEEFSKNLFILKNGKFHNKFFEIRIISSGASSIVCEVTDKDPNNNFAIKKIPFSDSNKLRVCQESRILLETISPYIVKCFDTWIEDNYYVGKDIISSSTLISSSIQNLLDNDKQNLLLHIQMEFCSMTLKDLMKKLSRELNVNASEIIIYSSFSICCELSLEILECLEFLHERNIIHRDIKPSNILITEGNNGRFIKLGDLGTAVIHESDDKTHTQFTGTLGFMSPENIASRKYGKKNDIYSLGKTMEELFKYLNLDSISVEQIKLKCSGIKNLINRMIDDSSELRPYCQEILESKDSWFLSLNEVLAGKSVVIDKGLIKCESKDNFHLYYIQTKLKDSVNFHDLRENSFVIV